MKSLKLLLAASFLLTSRFGYAGSATWNLSPASGDWNTAANWTPNTVPNSPADTATFGVSNSPSVTVSSDISLAGITFDSGASVFNINAESHVLSLYDAGVVNNSGNTQQFVLPVDSLGHYGAMGFFNSASAGSDTNYTLQGSILIGSLGGYIVFSDTSTAGEASFVVEGPGPGNMGNNTGGAVIFFGNSTAGNARFMLNPGGEGTPALVEFSQTSNAGNALIVANGSNLSSGLGGMAFFNADSDAGNSTLIAYGTQPGFAAGGIGFADATSGSNARIKVFGTGYLDIHFVNHPILTIGSLEGDGNVILGGQTLRLGRNDLSTQFDGVISGRGSLTKIGGGQLILTNANTYTAGTTVMRGSVLVNNISGSATGTGPVSVVQGALGGSGIVSGAVTIGSGATLGPGKVHAIGTLTLGRTLTFAGEAIYDFGFNSSRIVADNVVAKGITIMSGAVISMTDGGGATLPLGTIFTALSNTATTPIAGTFANLPDGGTVTVGDNTFQANYEGGDGNDLTLTIVP